jgi:uncharacterized protein (TIGR02117 family)
MIKKIIRILFNVLAGILSFFILYIAATFIFSIIPVNSKQTTNGTTTIYLLSNGVHTDLALPVSNKIKDWRQEVKFEHTAGKDSTYKYVAFGWGDKGFFLNTPTWGELKFSTAFKAAFGINTTAIHATFYKTLKEGDRCVKLSLSDEQYQNLIKYIQDKFKRDKDGNTQNIVTTANYGLNDAFYEAKGHYSLFVTCNTWTNSALKACNQTACLWTPWDKGIFWHYGK